LGLFILVFCILASMYGGGFATAPAYLADLFGTKYVGAIHGRLLTAWSTAGVVGPLLVANMRDRAIAAGVPRSDIYPPIFWVLAAMLVAGFVANLFVRPVAAKFHMAADDRPIAVDTVAGGSVATATGTSPIVVLAWLAVGLPILWGIYMTLSKALILLK
jgi:hypothetical protein